jgi:ATP-dependent Clp protease protease subunit
MMGVKMSINIFGVVGEDVRADKVVEQIQAEKSDTLEFNIMSPGGSVIEGLAIFDAARASGKNIITRAMGQAASIASIIFMAGDVREVADNAEIMIHNAMVFAGGNKHELSSYIDRLDGIDKKLINIYASKTNLNEDQVRELLDNETFMDADEAVEKGFATVKADALALVAQYNKSTNKENKEPVKMATEEETKAGFLAHMMAYFKSDVKAENMEEEETPENMEEEEVKAMEEGEEIPEKEDDAAEEAKAMEEGEEEPEAMEEEESEEMKALKAELEEAKNKLAAAEAKAEEDSKTEKEEAVAVAGLIFDAITDNKVTMHEAKNLYSKPLTSVEAVLKEREVNATGRGKTESPKGDDKGTAYDQYQAISDPAERKTFFAKNKTDIINQSKES